MPNKIVWDEYYDTAKPYFRCPTCGNEFFGDGRALHASSCKSEGFDNCDIIVGPASLAAEQEWEEAETLAGNAEAYNGTFRPHPDGIPYAMLIISAKTSGVYDPNVINVDPPPPSDVIIEPDSD
jgi:hypothetical protein